MKGKNIIILVILVVVIAGLFLGFGYFLGKGKAEGNKADNDTKQEEKKEEKNDDSKEYTKEEQKENVDEKTKNHVKCVVCDEEGNLCCPTDGGKESNYYLDLKDIDKDASPEPYDLNGSDYKYKVEYTLKNGEAKVKINNKLIYDDHYKVDYIFVLDNGVLGIEYHDETDQALLRKRIYYDKNFNTLKKVEGIKSNVDLFATEYEFVEPSRVCIDNKYREIKTYKALISSNSVRVEFVKTEKEESCAGMTD